MTKVTLKKYGMKWDSIRYWQNQAWDLWRYNGIMSGLSIWRNGDRYKDVPARDIGHAIIGLAHVAGRWSNAPERIRTLLVKGDWR